MTESEALEIARQAAVEQIRLYKTTVDDPSVESRHINHGSAIEAGKFLVSLMKNEAVTRQKIAAKNMETLSRLHQH